MFHQLLPQEFLDLRLAGAAVEATEQRGEHAVVLVPYLVSDADRVPLIEQMP
ncbi:hypothetical protein [Streptomyces sp. NPDC051000]|uniref:hypothetical protein n=1 Tax=Streptomyces sp. NPDC051000 TaxID=3155520 RepID=UPI0034116706